MQNKKVQLKVLNEVEVSDFIKKLTEKKWSFVDGYKMLLEFVGASSIKYRHEYDKEAGLHDFDFDIDNKVIDIVDEKNMNNEIGDFYISYTIPANQAEEKNLCLDDIEQLSTFDGGYWSAMFNGEHSVAVNTEI